MQGGVKYGNCILDYFMVACIHWRMWNWNNAKEAITGRRWNCGKNPVDG